MSDERAETRFWEDGRCRLEAALDEAERVELSELQARLSAATEPADRRKLELEIDELKARYREERRALLYRLFSGA